MLPGPVSLAGAKGPRQRPCRGRCISATHEAAGAVRVMMNCMQFGQAAGVAAALSAQDGTRPREIDPALLRARLEEQGCRFLTYEIQRKANPSPTLGRCSPGGAYYILEMEGGASCGRFPFCKRKVAAAWSERNEEHRFLTDRERSTMTDRLGPITLSGRFVRLEPLRPHHAKRAPWGGVDEAIWRWMSKRLMDQESLSSWIEEAMAAERQGREYAFAVVRRADDRIVGSTRYMEIRALHRGVEIGWTWYAKDVWGDGGQSARPSCFCSSMLLRIGAPSM